MPEAAVEQEQKFEALLDYLKRTRGFDFTGYKRSSLMRRVQKRMEVSLVTDFVEYMDYLEVHPDEFVQLFNMILINVTSFFRDEPVWDYVRDFVIPEVVRSRDGSPLRAWVAGCASGEEAYTLAMLLCEAVGEDKFLNQVKIYATDADDEAVGEARMATYGLQVMQTVPLDLREKYFVQTNSKLAFRPDLRRSVIFGRHDLVQDAPISNLDLLFCRNTLMYLNAETQTRILHRFHYALKDDGYIVLGKAEMLLSHTELFTPVEMKCRVFRTVPKASSRDRILALANSQSVSGADNGGDTHPRMRELSFDASLVPQIVVDIDGSLVLANQRARALFHLGHADIGRPLQELEVSYRPIDLRTLIAKAQEQHMPIRANKVQRKQSDGRDQFFDVEVAPLAITDSSSVGTSITFNDVTTYHQVYDELQQANQELETTNEELQSAHEELETTNEELQSTNEELETTNEELQSTNEELETMNEELQSTNEELETTNNELRAITKELNSANGFLESILASLRNAVIVLDRQFKIIIWSQRCEELWGMRQEEVVGEPFLNLDCGLPVEQLKEPIKTFLRDGKTYSESVLEAMNRRGKIFTCRVRVTPLDHTNKEVRGVVLSIDEVPIDEAHEPTAKTK
jgi:two-component system CheB/CheR fusion protein